MAITLKAARVNSGLTQTQVAEAMGVTKMTVAAWENGKRRVKPAYMPMISQILGVPVDDIILPKVITKSNRKAR